MSIYLITLMANLEKERKQLKKECCIVFSQMPELKTLASNYWHQVTTLDLNDKDILEAEERILTETVVHMADILLEDSIFQEAMKKTGTNPVDNAIQEALMMIDIIPDLGG